MSFPDVCAFTLSGNGPIRNLCLVSDRGYLKFDDRDVLNQTCKFTTEIAETDALLGFHIRCLYNNKYLVRQESSDWLVATSSEKEEDTSKRECTLFKRVATNDPNVITLNHVQSNRTVRVEKPDDPTIAYYLSVKPNSGAVMAAEFTVKNVNDIIMLPRYVVLKENQGQLLSMPSGESYPRFSGTDSHNRDAWFETFRTSNGDVRLKSTRTGKFLRRRDNWILCDSDDTSSNDRDTIFHAHPFGNNETIALMNRGNNLYCTKRTADGRTNALAAVSDSAVGESHLAVEEPVTERQMTINYRLQHSRVYDSKPKTWVSADAINEAEQENSFSLNIVYTESYSVTTSRSRTISTNVSTTVNVKVPLVAKKEVSIDAGLDLSTGWEETKGESVTHTAIVNVTIPGRETRAAKMLCLEGKSDVPFSYLQRDRLANGDWIETVLDDGVLRGINGYHFVIQIFDPTNPSVPPETRSYTPVTLPDFVQEGIEEEYASRGIKLVMDAK